METIKAIAEFAYRGMVLAVVCGTALPNWKTRDTVVTYVIGAAALAVLLVCGLNEVPGPRPQEGDQGETGGTT